MITPDTYSEYTDADGRYVGPDGRGYDGMLEDRHERWLKDLTDAARPKELVILASLSDTRLRELHDAVVTSDVAKPVDQHFYLDELNRRVVHRQTMRMIRLTYATLALTVVTAAVAIIALVLA